jgi:hypothetical protein
MPVLHSAGIAKSSFLCFAVKAIYRILLFDGIPLFMNSGGDENFHSTSPLNAP